jgi:hypothetical protein
LLPLLHLELAPGAAGTKLPAKESGSELPHSKPNRASGIFWLKSRKMSRTFAATLQENSVAGIALALSSRGSPLTCITSASVPFEARRGPQRRKITTAFPSRSISLGYHCAACLSSPRRLALPCHIRSGWNEADTSKNDLRIRRYEKFETCHAERSEASLQFLVSRWPQRTAEILRFAQDDKAMDFFTRSHALSGHGPPPCRP